MKYLMAAIMALMVQTVWADSPACTQGRDAMQGSVDALKMSDRQNSCTWMRQAVRLLSSCETTSESTFAAIKDQKDIICNETGYSRDNQWCRNLPPGTSVKELARKGCF
jgi:hypothetical protein